MTEKQVILEPEKCLEIIRKKLGLDSVKEFSLHYEFEPRKKFSGYLGQYYNLQVTLVNQKSSVVKKLNFFVKMLPMMGVQYDFVKESRCFETERGLYLKIFPKMFTAVEKNFIPECFLGIKDYALVLEDMSNEGYKMLDKFQFLQLEHFLIIIKNLARLHARSLIFEEKNRMTVLEFCLSNKILINTADTVFQATLDCFSKNLMAMVDLIEDIDLEQKEKCKAKIARISSQHYTKTAPSTKDTNVLCHADLWTNNILFRHDKNRKVNQCCFIDFQMARYCSPAYDILYLLYCTTSREFRRDASESLFVKYYEILAESLNDAKINLKDIFSWNNFKDSITEFKLSCMIHAFATMSVSYLGTDASDQRMKELLPTSKIVYEEFKKNERYRKRMLDNMLDLCDHFRY